MKRLLLTLTALLTFFGAQSQVIYSEDFDGIGGPTAGGAGTYTFPPGFLLRNVDNATPATNVSYVNEAWERREDFSFNVSDSAAFSTSWTTPASTVNDWMWTPLVGPIPTNTVLRWNAVTYDAAYRDGYEVRIMVAASGPPTGGTGAIGNQITNSTVVYSTGAENTTWTAREVPLSAYAGQSIYIGFRNNSTDKFLLLIDDIQVVQIVNNDLRVVSGTVSHGEYTKAPATNLTTTQNIQLQGTIQNSGVMAATNARLACDVIIDGVYSSTVQSAATASMASGATEVKTIAYTPTADGDYDFRFYPMMDVADQQTNNDTIYDPIGLVVDPTEMRRDDGIGTGSLGIGAGVTGYIGQTFNFETAVNIASVKTTFARGYTNRRLATVVYATDGAGVPTTFVATTDTLLYIDDSARTYTLPMNGGTLNLAAGKYAFLQVEFDSTLAVVNTMNIFRNNTVFVQWPTSPFGAAFAPVESFGASFARTFMIAPQFDMCVGETGGSVTNTTQAGCGMNDGSAEVTLDAGYTITWEDNTTNPIHTSLGAGFHTFTMENEYCTMVDSVEITNPNAPTATATNIENADCFGDEGSADLDIQNGTAPYTVTWSNGDSGIQITDVAGTYSAVIVDDNNCSVTVTGVTITEPTELTAASSGTDETCDACDDGTATITPTGGTAPYAYVWSNGGNTSTITGLAPGTYTVTVTDANGCTTTGSVSVSEFVGLNELANDGIVVYPNPVVDFLALEAKKNNVTGAVLIDASGRMISELTQTNNTFTADMRTLAKGVYQLVISTTEGTLVTSVAKQ